MKKIFLVLYILCLSIKVNSQTTASAQTTGLNNANYEIKAGESAGPGAKIKLENSTTGNLEMSAGFDYSLNTAGAVKIKSYGGGFEMITSPDAEPGAIKNTFSFYSNTSTNLLRKKNVKFGIGTKDPQNTLHLDNLAANDGIKLGDLGMLRAGFSDRNQLVLESTANGNGNLFLYSLKGMNIFNENGPLKLGTAAGSIELSSSSSSILLNKNAGHVGIGTASPEDRLQIGNTFTFHDGGHKIIGFGHSPGKGWVNRNNPNVNGDLDVNNFAGEIRFIPSDGSIHIGSSTTVNNVPSWNGIGNFMSLTREGKLGVGILDPKAKLHVNGFIINGGADFRLGINDGRSQGEKKGNRALVHFNNDALHLNYAGDFEGGVVVDSKIEIKGKVGIGTSDTKGYELGVKGKIAAQEVKVALYGENGSGWADFVFEDDYNLPTLKEVETHIAEKGRLKDIPSAATVEKDGIFLGQMDAKLLQKIEELTLYTIEQEKKIETLKSKLEKVESLESQVEELKTLIKTLVK